jgi:hypothetical protein
MTDERHTVTYHGPAALGGLLGQYLRDEGCAVAVPSKQERRDLPGAAEAVAVQLVVAGAIAAVRAAVAKFKARQPHAKVDVDDDHDAKGYL